MSYDIQIIKHSNNDIILILKQNTLEIKYKVILKNNTYSLCTFSFIDTIPQDSSLNFLKEYGFIELLNIEFKKEYKRMQNIYLFHFKLATKSLLMLL